MNVFTPLDKMRHDALTDKQRDSERLHSDTVSAVDSYIPIKKPRGSVVTSRFGTFTPLPLLRPEQARRPLESDEDWNRKETNLYLQVSALQPMLSSLCNIMKEWFTDPTAAPLWNAALFAIPYDALIEVFNLKDVYVVDDAESDPSGSDSDGEGDVDYKKAATRKGKAQEKEKTKEDLRIKKLHLFKSKLKFLGEWPAIFTRETKVYKEYFKNLMDVVALFKHFLIQSKKCKTILDSRSATEIHIHKFLSFVSTLSVEQIFAAGSLSSVIRLLSFTEHPLMQCTLRILVTIGTANAKSEKSFSAMGLIKTVLRSSMTQDWFNDLSFISINRFLDVKYEDFLKKFKELYPESLIFTAN